jgi:hypothetical protein
MYIYYLNSKFIIVDELPTDSSKYTIAYFKDANALGTLYVSGSELQQAKYVTSCETFSEFDPNNYPEYLI